MIVAHNTQICPTLHQKCVAQIMTDGNEFAHLTHDACATLETFDKIQKLYGKEINLTTLQTTHLQNIHFNGYNTGIMNGLNK